MTVAATPLQVSRPAVQWAGVAKILALIVLTCACYAPSLSGGFLWDDDLWIAHNPLVQSLDGLRRIWFSTDAYDYYPLTSTSFWLEWHLWGADPLGYRVVNLLLHVLNAFLFWRVLVRLRLPGAWFGALLFAVHPVNVASVAWIAERKNTLSMAFALTALWCWTESEDHPTDRRGSWLWYAGAVAAFTCAALSKSSVVMLPCVLLLLVWWRRGTIRRGDLVRSAPFFGVSLAAGLGTMWFQFHRSMDPGWQHTVAPLPVRLGIAGRSIGFYLGKTLWPVRLSMIYPRWETGSWLALAGMVALLFAAWLGRARWGRGPVTALGAFVLLVLPVSGLVPMTFFMYSFVSDHFVYLPLLGLLAGIAAALTLWSERGGAVNRYAAFGVMTAWTVLLVTASIRRADEFSSSRRLWEATLARNPGCAIAQNNLGIAIEDANHLPEAETLFRGALHTDPQLPEALTNLAAVLQHEGRWREASDAYVAAIQRLPDARDYNNHGVVLLQLGEVERAQEQFRAAARLETSMLSPHFNLYKVAIARGDVRSAEDDLRACLRIDPDDVPSLLALAALEIKGGPQAAGADAVALAERACRLTQGIDAVALGTLSRVYLAAGRPGDAIATGERAQAAARRNQQPALAAQISEYLETLRKGS